jgi:acyl CoA:acetate/3-ketoacid CoA transferase alpha subunit
MDDPSFIFDHSLLESITIVVSTQTADNFSLQKLNMVEDYSGKYALIKAWKADKAGNLTFR